MPAGHHLVPTLAGDTHTDRDGRTATGRLLRTEVPGVQPSELCAIELPMAHARAPCKRALSATMTELVPATLA
jgi:hypothetical protein